MICKNFEQHALALTCAWIIFLGGAHIVHQCWKMHASMAGTEYALHHIPNRCYVAPIKQGNGSGDSCENARAYLVLRPDDYLPGSSIVLCGPMIYGNRIIFSAPQ